MRLAVAWLLVAHSVFSAALSKALMSYRGPAVQDRAVRGRALRHLIKHTNFRYTTFFTVCGTTMTSLRIPED